MNNSDDDLRQAIALFRYGVIADLVHLPLGTPGIGDKLRDKASQPYTIPGSERTHVAAESIRGWIKLYRYGGFEALYPMPRTDRGQPRRRADTASCCRQIPEVGAGCVNAHVRIRAGALGNQRPYRDTKPSAAMPTRKMVACLRTPGQ